MSNLLTICCPCLFGLESVLAGEVRRMGGQEVQVQNGKVIFQGDSAMLPRANLRLRTAERVLLQLGSFHAATFDELFEGTRNLPFEEFIGSTDAFPVKGWSLNSQLHSVPDCQSIIKKAAVRRMQEAYYVSWFQETGAVHQIQFSIHKDQATLYLDTSGAGLHKRGYRPQANLAPLKETLAAGIIDLAHVRENSTVIDPFCGSGTFVIESALHALRIAPGLKRHFAAEQWDWLPNTIWETERQEARTLIRRDAAFRGYGSDIDDAAVELSQINAQKAGIAPRVRFKQSDIAHFVPPDEPATVFCNPPYGERLLDLRQAEDLYRTMGRVFPAGQGINYYILSSHEQFEELFGRKADKRRKLYNGMIKCQLFMYYK